MARNAEKAMTTLARWRQSQLEEQGQSNKSRRPYLASECNDLKDAQKWRLDIVREISKKVTQIQNAGLGEFRIRDLNDQINKLLREKRHWEYRIGQLGGYAHRYQIRSFFVKFIEIVLIDNNFAELVRDMKRPAKKWLEIVAISTSERLKTCREFESSSQMNRRFCRERQERNS